MGSIPERPRRFLTIPIRALIGIFLLALFAGWICARPFLVSHTLYWDNYRFLSIYRDQLQALNHFGEVAWYFPHAGYGWPAYYYSILGDLSCGGPTFVGIGTVVWLIGRNGIYLNKAFFYIYVLHFAFLSPLLLNLSVYLNSRQWLRSGPARCFAVILSAFSPGVVLNMSDIGFAEPVAFGLFFVASWTAFLRHPSQRTWLSVGVCGCLLGLTVNYPFFTWNAVFLPVAIAMPVLIKRRGWSLVREAFKRVPMVMIGGTAIAVALCMLPSLTSQLLVGDMVRVTIRGAQYDLRELKPGSALEVFLAGIPSLGFEYAPSWTPLLGATQRVCYGYLGVITLPLAVFVLLRGSRIQRRACLFLGIYIFGIVLLGAGSPFFGLVLTFNSPLRANKHWNDLIFRSGGFLILISAASLGLDIFLRRQKAGDKKLLLCLLAAFAAVSIWMVTNISENAIWSDAIFGHMLFMLVLFGCVVYWIKPRDLQLFPFRGAIPFFLLLVLLDVATSVQFYSWRQYDAHSTTVVDQINSDGVGYASRSTDYSLSLVIPRPQLWFLDHGIPPAAVPEFAMFTHWHAIGDLTGEWNSLQHDKWSGPASLGLDPGAATSDPTLALLEHSGDIQPTDWDLHYLRTFNSVQLKTSCAHPTILFIRAAYSPLWKARSESGPLPVMKALSAFIAIPVPAGTHDITLGFHPTAVGTNLIIAYTVFIIALISWWLTFRRGKNKNSQR